MQFCPTNIIAQTHRVAQTRHEDARLMKGILPADKALIKLTDSFLPEPPLPSVRSWEC